MSSNYLLTRYRQSSNSLTSTSNLWDRLSSPSIEPQAHIPSLSPSPARFTRPSTPDSQSSGLTDIHSITLDTTQSSDLFAALLLNREQAYRESSYPATSRLPARSKPEPRRTYTPTSCRNSSEDCISRNFAGLFGHERRDLDNTSRDPAPRREYQEDIMVPRSKVQPETKVPEVSKRRGRSAKKDTAKTKEKVQESKTRKRKAVTDISRGESASKAPRKRVPRTDSKANIKKKVDISGGGVPTKIPASEVIVIDSDSENEKNAKTIDPNMLRSLTKLLPPCKTPIISTPVKEEATPVPRFSSDSLTPGCSVSDHTSLIEELEKVRQELQTERELAQRLRQELEKCEASAFVEKENYEARARKELEAERQKSREQQKAYQDIHAKQTKLDTECKVLQVQAEQEKTARKQEQNHHAEVLQDILKSKTEGENAREQVQSLLKDNTRLLAENEALKAISSAPRKLPTLSPVPSSTSSTDEEKRDENVRKMYIKVKRQYDILHSVANELATCTRSLDLSSFGEFGIYIRKLRNSLDTDGSASAEKTQNGLKVDEDTDSETKRPLA